MSEPTAAYQSDSRDHASYAEGDEVTSGPDCIAVSGRGEIEGGDSGRANTSPAAPVSELESVVRELRRRAEVLTERYAPQAQVRRDRLVMVGDAGVMEYAASVIEKAIKP